MHVSEGGKSSIIHIFEFLKDFRVFLNVLFLNICLPMHLFGYVLMKACAHCIQKMSDVLELELQVVVKRPT